MGWSNGTHEKVMGGTGSKCTYFEGLRPASYIDHILVSNGLPHLGNMCAQKTMADIEDTLEDTVLSDHRVLWATIAVPVSMPRVKQHKPLEGHRRWDLQLDKTEECDEFTTELRERVKETRQPGSAEEAVVTVTELERMAVSVMRKVRPRKLKVKGFQGLSIEFLARKELIEVIVDIRRHLVGEGGRKKWIDRDIPGKVAKMARAAEKGVIRWHASMQDPPWQVQQVVPITLLRMRDIYNNRMCTRADQVGYCGKMVDHMKAALQGRQRRELQMKISKHVATRERNFREGKVSQTYRALTENYRDPYPMQAIQIGERISTDGEEVHMGHTDHFGKKWFAVPEECINDPLQQKDGKWKEYFHNKEAFMEAHRSTGVPDHLLGVVWEGMVYPYTHNADGKRLYTNPPRETGRGTIRASMEKDMQRAFAPDNPPTLQQLTAKVRSMKKDSAGGFTGTTYNMLKHAPKEYMERLHQCIEHMWREQVTPEHWKLRWLAPIGKVPGTVNVEETRPLMLLEVGRKLLQGLMMDRLLPIWERHRFLGSQAHGAIRGKGTHTATVELINTMEQIEVQGASLYTSSWDWRHAFDSLSAAIKEMTWYRGGLPEGAIELLEQLDRGNITVVRTPFAVAHAASQEWAKHHVDANEDAGAPTVEAFEAERGDCQGAPPSAPHWVGFFDILNRGLEVAKLDEIYLRTSKWKLGKAKDVAFVDDLQSVAPTMEALQGKADIVSAFAIVMGMLLSLHKLRFLVAHYGENDKTEQEEEEEVLIVHQRGWIPHAVHQKREDLTYIGIRHDILPNLGGPRSNHELGTMQRLRSGLRTIDAKYASRAVKIQTATVCTMAAAAYKGGYDTVTLAKQGEARAAFDGMIRKWLQKEHMATDLLHIDTAGGGCGIPCMEDRFNRQKLTTLFSMLNSANEHSQAAADGVLERILGACHETCPGVRGVIDKKRGVGNADITLWAQSLIEWLGQWDLALVRGGITPPEGLKPFEPGGRDKFRSQRYGYMEAVGVATEEDIHWRDEGMYITQPYDEIEDQAPCTPDILGSGGGSGNGEWIGNRKRHPDKVQWGQHLGRHQVWMLLGSDSDMNGLPFEVMGYDETSGLMRIRVWKREERVATRSRRRAQRPAAAGDWVTLSTPTRGAGTECEIEAKILLEAAPRTLQRLVLSRDYKHKKDGSLRRYVHACSSAPCPKLVDGGEGCSIEGEIQWLERDRRSRLKCYTDGSFKDETMAFRKAFGRKLEKVRSGGALVFMSPGEDWREDRIRIIRLTDIGKYTPNSVYPAELGSIVMARALGKATGKRLHIHTDSQASIKTLSRRTNKGVEPAAILAQIGMKDAGVQPAIKHVSAHAEKKKKMEEWDQDMMGNFIADKAAGGATTEEIRGCIAEHCSAEMEMRDCSMATLLEYCKVNANYFIADRRTGDPILWDLARVTCARRTERYTRTRERDSDMSRDWPNLCVESLAPTLDLRGKSPIERAALIWMGYGLTYYGERVGRHGMEKTTNSIHVTTGCIVCNQREGINHILLQCSHEEAVEARNEAMAEILKLLRWYKGENGIIATALEAMVEGAMKDEPDKLLWQGLWDEDTIRDVGEAVGYDNLTEVNAKDLIKAVRSLKKIFVKHTRLAGRLRTKWHIRLQRSQNYADNSKPLEPRPGNRKERNERKGSSKGNPLERGPEEVGKGEGNRPSDQAEGMRGDVDSRCPTYPLWNKGGWKGLLGEPAKRKRLKRTILSGTKRMKIQSMQATIDKCWPGKSDDTDETQEQERDKPAQRGETATSTSTPMSVWAPREMTSFNMGTGKGLTMIKGRDGRKKRKEAMQESTLHLNSMQPETGGDSESKGGSQALSTPTSRQSGEGGEQSQMDHLSLFTSFPTVASTWSAQALASPLASTACSGPRLHGGEQSTKSREPKKTRKLSMIEGGVDDRQTKKKGGCVSLKLKSTQTTIDKCWQGKMDDIDGTQGQERDRPAQRWGEAALLTTTPMSVWTPGEMTGLQYRNRKGADNDKGERQKERESESGACAHITNHPHAA